MSGGTPAPSWPWRWTVATAGWCALGSGVGAMIASGWGVSPYDAVITGIAARAGLPAALALLVLALGVLVGALAVSGGGRRPDWGTLVGPFVISGSLAAGLSVVGELGTGWARAAAYGAGMAGVLGGICLVCASRVGMGPLELLMFALADRGLRVHQARWVVELSLLATAWVLGGQLGWGTVAMVVAGGPALAVGIPAASRALRLGVGLPVAARPGPGVSPTAGHEARA